jgi:hypothetical protein
LEFSQHLNQEECSSLIQQLVSNFKLPLTTQMERNIRLDLFEISQICGKLNRKNILAFALNTDNSVIQNTILFALERVLHVED